MIPYTPNITLRSHRWGAVACLVGLFAFHAVNNFIWTGLDQRIVWPDEASNATFGLEVLEVLQHPSWTTMGALIAGGVFDSPYPPLRFLCMGLFNLLWGTSLAVSHLSNLPFFAVLLFSVYGIGKQMRGSAFGLVAAFLVSMYPEVFGLSRSTQPDFALTAMVAYSLYCLLAANGFARVWPSVRFGLSLGLGLMTKQAFVLFLLPPLVMAVVDLWRTSSSSPRSVDGQNQWFNFGCALAIAALVAGPWYILRLPGLFSYGLWAAYDVSRAPGGISAVFSIPSLLFYTDALARHQILPIFFALFIIGLLRMWRQPGRGKWYWLWSLLGPYVTFTLFAMKVGKYTAPYLGVVALVSTMGLWMIRRPGLRRAAISVVISIGLTQYFVGSYPSSMTPNILFQPQGWCPLGHDPPQWILSPVAPDAQVPFTEVLAWLAEVRQPSAPRATLVAEGFNCKNPESLACAVTELTRLTYYCKREGLPYETGDVEPPITLVTLEGQPPYFFLLTQAIEQVASPVVAKDVVLLKQRRLSDGSHVYLYMRYANEQG